MVKEWPGHCTEGLLQYKYIRATAKTNDWLESGLSDHHLERELQTNLNQAKNYIRQIVLRKYTTYKSLSTNYLLLYSFPRFYQVWDVNNTEHLQTRIVFNIKPLKSQSLTILEYFGQFSIWGKLMIFFAIWGYLQSCIMSIFYTDENFSSKFTPKTRKSRLIYFCYKMHKNLVYVLCLYFKISCFFQLQILAL